MKLLLISILHLVIQGNSLFGKDLSKVNPDFKSVPPQLYFEIAGLASTKKWREIQNMAGEEQS